MKVQMDNKEMEAAIGTITGPATQLQLPENGIAITVNNQATPRPQRDELSLHGNDNLIVIKIAYGE